jgi:hypothetical protein
MKIRLTIFLLTLLLYSCSSQKFSITNSVNLRDINQPVKEILSLA